MSRPYITTEGRVRVCLALLSTVDPAIKRDTGLFDTMMAMDPDTVRSIFDLLEFMTKIDCGPLSFRARHNGLWRGLILHPKAGPAAWWVAQHLQVPQGLRVRNVDPVQVAELLGCNRTIQRLAMHLTAPLDLRAAPANGVVTMAINSDHFKSLPLESFPLLETLSLMGAGGLNSSLVSLVASLRILAVDTFSPADPKAFSLDLAALLEHSDCRLTDVRFPAACDAAILGRALRGNRTLCKVAWGCPDVEPLAAALETHPTICSVDLSRIEDCEIDLTGVISRSRYVHTLVLSPAAIYCFDDDIDNIDDDVIVICANALVQALAKSTSLYRLRLSFYDDSVSAPPLLKLGGDHAFLFLLPLMKSECLTEVIFDHLALSHVGEAWRANLAALGACVDFGTFGSIKVTLTAMPAVVVGAPGGSLVSAAVAKEADLRPAVACALNMSSARLSVSYLKGALVATHATRQALVFSWLSLRSLQLEQQEEEEHAEGRKRRGAALLADRHSKRMRSQGFNLGDLPIEILKLVVWNLDGPIV